MLTPAEFVSLCEYLEGEVRAVQEGTRWGCDGKLTKTQEWLKAHGYNVRANLAVLREFGGCCDCDVLLNVSVDAFGKTQE